MSYSSSGYSPSLMDRIKDFSDERPIASIAGACGLLASVAAGGVGLYNQINLPTIHLNEAARQILPLALDSTVDLDHWTIDSSHFDFPEVRKKHDIREPNEVSLAQNVNLSAEKPLMAAHIRAVFSDVQDMADRRGNLTGNDSIIRYRKAESCHPASQSCSDQFRQSVVVSAEYSYTTMTTMCTSNGKTTSCHPVISTNYSTVEREIPEIALAGSSISQNIDGYNLVSSLRQTREQALIQSDGLQIAQSRGINTSMPSANIG